VVPKPEAKKADGAEGAAENEPEAAPAETVETK